MTRGITRYNVILVMDSDKELARKAVRTAIRDGRLRSEPCVICWSLPTHAHHPRGYDEDHRLDVVWLCGRCHERIHGRRMGPYEYSDLRQMRLDAGVTIRQLEAKTGINRGRLSILERGVTPGEQEQRLILAALGKEPAA